MLIPPSYCMADQVKILKKSHWYELIYIALFWNVKNIHQNYYFGGWSQEKAEISFFLIWLLGTKLQQRSICHPCTSLGKFFYGLFKILMWVQKELLSALCLQTIPSKTLQKAFKVWAFFKVVWSPLHKCHLVLLFWHFRNDKYCYWKSAKQMDGCLGEFCEISC